MYGTYFITLAVGEKPCHVIRTRQLQLFRDDEFVGSIGFTVTSPCNNMVYIRGGVTFSFFFFPCFAQSSRVKLLISRGSIVKLTWQPFTKIKQVSVSPFNFLSSKSFILHGLQQYCPVMCQNSIIAYSCSSH